MKLPLSLVDEIAGQYTLYDSTGDVIASYEKWDVSINADFEEMKVMVDSTNNFPEAIRLLKLAFEELDYSDVRLCNSINQFLTKLEEDEK